MKIESFEAMARTMVGDGQSPNIFFVSVGKAGCVLITTDFDEAYQYWRKLPRNIETMLEDRKYGTICDTSPDEEGSTKLRTWDNSSMFCEQYHIPLLISQFE